MADSAVKALSLGVDAIHYANRPPPTAPTGYYDWEVSSDPASGRKGHSLVNNLISEVETLRSKGTFKPDPNAIVSFSFFSMFSFNLFNVFSTQAAFADTIQHPTAVDDRKGAVSDFSCTCIVLATEHIPVHSVRLWSQHTRQTRSLQ